MSSDGSQRVISGGGHPWSEQDYSVRVWDSASGTQLAVLQGHSENIRCITASSDGPLAASASEDGTICVWDLTFLSLCTKFEVPKSFAESVLFV